MGGEPEANNVMAREHGSRKAHQERQLGKIANGVLEEKTDGAEGRTKEGILLLALIEVRNLLR